VNGFKKKERGRCKHESTRKREERVGLRRGEGSLENELDGKKMVCLNERWCNRYRVDIPARGVICFVKTEGS